MRVALRGALRFTSHRFTAGDLNFFLGFRVLVVCLCCLVCFPRLRDHRSSFTQ